MRDDENTTQAEQADTEQPKTETPEVKVEPKPEPKAEEPKPEQKQRRQRKPKADEPTLGRIVRYVTGAGTIRPAIITRVGDEVIDLTVFNSEGAVPATEVEHDSDAETPHSWHWPETN